MAKALGLALLLLGSQARAQTAPAPDMTPPGPGLPAPYPTGPGVAPPVQVPPGPSWSTPYATSPEVAPLAQVPPPPPLPIGSQVLPGHSWSVPMTTNDSQPVKYQPVSPRLDFFPGTPEESLSITPPGFEAIFNKLDSEAELQQRIKQQKADADPTTKVVFPIEPEVSREAYQGRSWPRRATYTEPYYVLYDRLFFEDLNSERYGWDLGIISPFVSTGIAIKDMLLFPMHAGTDPFRIHEANVGYCLPGDPVPYLIYPPEVSLTGAVLEAGVVVTLLAVFP